ncbi:MAG TPA: hypothetical protein VFV50_12015 [Bdellovibrionales bacterium]|nr:hypothetical protein [Bdellovibrionales bacterium]
MKKAITSSILLLALGTTAAVQGREHPWQTQISQIQSSPEKLREMRAAVARPRKRRCKTMETFRTNAMVRWIQNSGLFPYQGFQMIRDRSPFFEFSRDELLRVLGEEWDDSETDQLTDTPENETQPFSAAEEAEIKESTVEMFAAPMLLDFLDNFTRSVYDQIKAPLTITSLTTSPEHRIDNHCSHMAGFAFDLRPLPGTRSMTYWWNRDKSVYNRDMNHKLIWELIKRPEVKTIIFNDPHIMKAITQSQDYKRIVEERKTAGRPVTYIRLLNRQTIRGKRYPNSHHYHIHVELYPHEPMVELAEDLLKLAPMPKPKPRPKPQPKPAAAAPQGAPAPQSGAPAPQAASPQAPTAPKPSGPKGAPSV